MFVDCVFVKNSEDNRLTQECTYYQTGIILLFCDF